MYAFVLREKLLIHERKVQASLACVSVVEACSSYSELIQGLAQETRLWAFLTDGHRGVAMDALVRSACFN